LGSEAFIETIKRDPNGILLSDDDRAFEPFAKSWEAEDLLLFEDKKPHKL
jgi:hypothetical protein